MSRAAVAVLAALAAFGSTGCSGCGHTDGAADSGATPSTAGKGGDAGADGGLLAESRNATPVAASVVQHFLNPASLPKYDGPTAILEGTVYVRGAASPPLDQPPRSSCKNVEDYRLFRDGPADATGRRPLADAVVGVTGYAGYYVPARGDAVSVNVHDCSFEQRTIVLTFGQRLEITNTEKVNSNVYYAPQLTKDGTSSLMIAAPGNTVKVYFQKPGRDLLIDGMGHSHLFADVFAAISSLHVVTDRAGHFILPGIPVGELDVSAMHPAIEGVAAPDGGIQGGAVHQKLVFKAGETTHHDFEITYAPLPKSDAGAPKSASPGIH